MMEGLKVDCFQQALGDQFCAQRETPSSVEVVAVRLLAERAFSERFRRQTAAVIVGFAYYFPFLLLQSWNGSPVGLALSFRRPISCRSVSLQQAFASSFDRSSVVRSHFLM
jgi:hypothetical protein